MSSRSNGLMFTRPNSELPRGSAPVARAKTSGTLASKRPSQPCPPPAPLRRPSTSSNHPAIPPTHGGSAGCLRGKAKGVSSSLHSLKTQVSSLTSALQTAVDTWGAFCEDLAAEAERNKLEVTRLTALVKSQQTAKEGNSRNLSYEPKNETPPSDQVSPLNRSWAPDEESEDSYSDSYEHSYSSSYLGSGGGSPSEKSENQKSGSSGRSSSSVYSNSSDSELNQDPEDSC